MDYLKQGGRIGRVANLKAAARVAVVDGNTEQHKCHLPACETLVHPRLLLCAYHWRLVPTSLKLAVWEHYVPGQEVSKTPTAAYLKAAQAAIRAVAELVRLQEAKRHAS